MTDAGPLEARYKRALVRKFFTRFDMTLILGATFCGGLVASRLLVMLHVTSMPLRYVLAVVASYVVFFVLVRLWCAYIRWTWRQLASDVNASWDLSGGGRGGGGLFAGHGGRFGGAGAQGSWAESAAPQQAGLTSSELQASGAGSSTPSGHSSGWLPDVSFDIDLDEKAVVILIAFSVLLLSIAGAAVYMIWYAPSILPDAAFQLALATGLVKRARRMDPTGWIGSVWRGTWIPFAVVGVLAMGFGFVVNWYCPGAATLTSVWTVCLQAKP